MHRRLRSIARYLYVNYDDGHHYPLLESRPASTRPAKNPGTRSP